MLLDPSKGVGCSNCSMKLTEDPTMARSAVIGKESPRALSDNHREQELPFKSFPTSAEAQTTNETVRSGIRRVEVVLGSSRLPFVIGETSSASTHAMGTTRAVTTQNRMKRNHRHNFCWYCICTCESHVRSGKLQASKSVT